MEETFSVVKRLRCRFPLLTCMLALAVMLAVTLQAEQASGPQLPRRVDPEAQQLLHRAIEALGGQAFLNSKTLTTKGRVYAIRDESTAGLAPFQSYVQYPDKRRFSYGKSPPVILINNGDKGWEIDRYGLIDQPKEQLQRWIASNRYSLENLLRERINDPGILVLTSGVDFVDNVPTQGIEITEAGGANVLLDLSRQTFLPIRISYQMRNPKTGESDDYADVYADYKLFDGIRTPMHITRYVNGDRVGETFRNSAHYNDDYPASYFAPK
jgi:hypothetical protein